VRDGTSAERIADFALGVSYEDVPEPVARAAKLHLLDTLGCGLAASASGVGTAGRSIAGVAQEEGATVIGRTGAAHPHDAALANGMLCHALDFDDTHADSICHIGVVAGPAALAASEASGATGRDLLTAFIAANEVIARVGAAAAPGYMTRGYHPTSVCGVFGATAAAARLLGLSAVQATSALGIAGSMASGLFAYLGDGSLTKPIHAGWGAAAGLTAARLAAAGGEGPRAIFEDRFGFYAAYYDSGAVELDRLVETLGDVWLTPEVAFKAYPACHFIHGCLDAVAVLADRLDGGAGEVEEIVVSVPGPGIPLVLEPLDDKVRPRTDYDAKFSLPFSVASMLVHGHVDLSSYSADALDDARVLEIARRVRYREAEFGSYPRAFPGRVRITTRAGANLDADVPYQRGAPENPMTDDEVLRKFRSNAERALRPELVASLEAGILTLEAVRDVRSTLSPLADADAVGAAA
jgi:2-methylcitrate dehydratase PrpD